MDPDDWPEPDRPWARRYLLRAAGRSIPSEVLRTRVGELHAAVLEAGLPADEALGDPDALAAEDVRDLGTVEEEIAGDGGGGLRPALSWLGLALTTIAAVNAVLLVARAGWLVDVRTAPLVVALGIGAALVAVLLARLAWLAGRPGAAAAAGAAGLAVVVGTAAVAVGIGRDPVTWADAPTLVVAAASLVPGLICLAAVRLVPPPQAREDWTSEQWLRRFRSALLSRGVTVRTADEHVAEVAALLDAAGGGDPFAEVGDPVVLARRIGDADPRATWRRSAATAALRATVLLVIAAGALAGPSWGALRWPVAGLALVLAVGVAVQAWLERPGRAGA